MKLFYSIDELASIIGEAKYDTANALKAAGVLMTYQGEPADLSGWTGGISCRGNSVYIFQGYFDDPSPSAVLVLADSLPVSWIRKIELSEAESGGLISEDESGEPESAGLTEEAAHCADQDATLSALFDAVKVAQLEAMFTDSGRWVKYAERAERNGLKKAAKDGRAKFNPYRAASWWLSTVGPDGWTWDKCLRKLANNLPDRSLDSKCLLTGEYE